MKNKMFSFFRRKKEIIKIHFLIISMILILCSIFALAVFTVSESDLQDKTEAYFKQENTEKSYTDATKIKNSVINGNE